MTEELLSCPFCGKTDALRVVAASQEWDEDYFGLYPHSESWSVVCDASHPGGPGGCGAQAGASSKGSAAAIESWNTRSKE